RNFGWSQMEGQHCFAADCDASLYTLPIAEYSHDDGCSVTGGYVYRGSDYPALAGRYFFGDYCSGKIWSLTPDGDGWTMTPELDTDSWITSFGEDEAGELYLVDLAGVLYRVTTSELQSPSIDNPAMLRTWQRTDKPVADLTVDRTWMWGPEPFTNAIPEPYAESPDGSRMVQYFDKARMEITQPDAEDDGIWYVTNGLLVVEMMSGQIQTGDNRFESQQPATENVAGDPGVESGPTYATLAPLRGAPPAADSATLTQRIAPDGTVSDDPTMASFGITAAQRVQVPHIDHQIASVFWEFMNSTATVYEDGELVNDLLFVNPYYATGYPITEAYWTTILLDSNETDVLLQCFERRCLTYTPGNEPGWQVEAGNVGQHYYRWRYGS
ncbi:MAG TPA: hypothetical protein VFV93_07145, partial [Thermomicrobiales bacterium]|nr:hypothetical protein [Thermomicrobiales bacterium]